MINILLMNLKMKIVEKKEKLTQLQKIVNLVKIQLENKKNK